MYEESVSYFLSFFVGSTKVSVESYGLTLPASSSVDESSSKPPPDRKR